MSAPNTIPHYQTSFRVADDDNEALARLKANIYGWLLTKEGDKHLREAKSEFFYRCEWVNLYNTRSSIRTASYLSLKGKAWAMRYTHPDAQLSKKRFWYTDIGLAEGDGYVIVSVRVAYAWNAECLSNEREEPPPTVPKVLRYMLEGNHSYSGRPDFRLLQVPIRFNRIGLGQPLAAFIRSEDRRYPMILINGDDQFLENEAKKLALDLTGKCLVTLLSSDPEVQEEFTHFMPEDYRVSPGYLRVYFPFAKGNTPYRHRWYRINEPNYSIHRKGIVNGLLRHHALIELGAVESVQDIERLISREKLTKFVKADGTHNKELEAFYGLYAELEKERDEAKLEAQTWAAEVDAKQTEIDGQSDVIRSLQWQLSEINDRYTQLKTEVPDLPTRQLLPSLPSTLGEVAEAARRFFSRLDITHEAVKSATSYNECKSLNEAWEMLAGLNNALFRIKFEDGKNANLEASFKNETGYDLAMSEGRNTKRDGDLMALRKLNYNGIEYDITPHVKHGNTEPKMVRIHFAFDEKQKRIVVGYIGPHMENATSKKL